MAEEKYIDLPTGLYWKGKKTEVDRVVLPFQTIETINESRATRDREKVKGKNLFDADGEPIPSLQAMESLLSVLNHRSSYERLLSSAFRRYFLSYLQSRK